MTAQNPLPAELAKNYEPSTVERRLYERWEAAGYFHDEPDPARPPFIICMPPPNVTGRAHLGHGSTYTAMDVLTRYHRMQGENADWLPGFDHAAIATEAVLVRELKREGTSREQLGRPAYIERAWDWSRQYGGIINEQFRSIGFGPDWERARFTMDDGLSAAVRRVFVRLYEEGLIYRGKRLINWDPKAKTTISDAEIDHVDRDAHLWRVTYPYAAGSPAGITVATTRPETMLGDVAIAVHPDDARYRDLIGKTVLVPPLLERAIPIVADDVVDMAFGTGAVKVTPAHDATDYEIGIRHQLPMPSILDLDARITDADIAVGPYAGLDRFDARAKIVRDVRERGLLVAEEAYRHSVATSSRSGEIVEPLLSEQWFMTMRPLAAPALKAYQDGRLKFVPERYGRTYEQWLENIRDWNISRQVWWGHRLPVWYTPDGDIVVAETFEAAQEVARVKYAGADLTQDPDTLDTWFSSALWPFSILGWPEKTPELKHWYPSQVLMTGWEIIFLWVARMVMFGIHFLGEIPFPTVFISPLVFDAQGRKMSKSLGNAIDPLDLVGKFGADAFRMGMLRQMRLEGQEVRFQESRCEEARNFNNKIWNATRYLLALPEAPLGAMTLPAPAALSLADRWILTRLHDTILEVGAKLDGYDFGSTAETLWRFVWYELCDWYVEATKSESNAATRATVLSFVLNNAMRLLHPIAPFITEEVWLTIPHDGATIMTATWPDPEEVPVDREAAARFDAIRERVEGLRNERSENQIDPRALADATGSPSLDAYPAERDLLAAFAKLRIVFRGDAVAGSLDEALRSVGVAVSPAARRARLAKEEQRLLAEVERGERKLGNEQFLGKAAPDVVAKERAKLDGYRSELETVRGELHAIREDG
ncbi:MAG: valine--tRNA ligase [Candidatus Eremiobacteraeota bacterium]|nr:valine--tRNA ligase [Candidatus Eremiobacteraeota bacterium]